SSRSILNSQFSTLNFLFGAPERRVDVRIVPPEPVAKSGAQELLGRRRRRALHDPVLAVEKVGRVVGIRKHRTEAVEASENRRSPPPPAPDEILDAPGRRARGVGADRHRIRMAEVEVSSALIRRLFPPGIRALESLRRGVGRAMELR